MSVEEQIFHYSQGLENRIRVQIEWPEVATLPMAMSTADTMDSLYINHRRALYLKMGRVVDLFQ